ncbi:MAG: HEAT repeat domain-containing protein, partial [Polyangiaceae bacterium]
STEWTAEERDSVGVYTAEYRNEKETIKRHKKEYKPGSLPGSTYRIVGGETEFHLDEAGILSRFVESDDLQIDAPEPLPSFQSRTRIALSRVKLSDRQATVDLKAETARMSSLDPNATSPDALREIETARIGGLELPETLSRLMASREREIAGALTKNDSRETGRAYISLTARLRTQPSEIAAVRAHIEKNGPISDVLVDALKDAGTPQAQRALSEILASKGASENRLGLVRALSGVGAPTRDTVAALRSVENDPSVGTQAKYGLGSNAYRLQKTDPALAEDVMKHLLGELRQASTGDQKCTLLTALGNAGSADSVTAILPFFENDSPAIRACAAQALRRIPGAEADALLARASHDSAEEARYAAVEAISDRTPSGELVTVIARTATQESVNRIRASAVHTAARWVGARPELAQALTLVAEKDPVPDLQRAARRALTKDSTKGAVAKAN